MKAFQAKRLRKLADHLKKGRLAHAKFDFSVLSKLQRGKKLRPAGCGTVGCAIGELPAVFPRKFKYGKYWPGDRHINVVERGDGSGDFGPESGMGAACNFFGITGDERNLLFYPKSQVPSWLSFNTKTVKQLGPKATRQQVAKNLYAFLKAKGY